MYDEKEGQIFNCQIHGFGEASSKAYCVVVYLIYVTREGVKCRLICSKTRVAPLKEFAIQRLELLSVRNVNVLVDKVYKALCTQVKIEMRSDTCLTAIPHFIGYIIMVIGSNGSNLEPPKH